METRTYWTVEINDLGQVEVVDDLGLHWLIYGSSHDELIFSHCSSQVEMLASEYLRYRDWRIAKLQAAPPTSPEAAKLLDEIEELENYYRGRLAALLPAR